MALEILYSELSKDFRIDENGKLFRLSDRCGREKEVEIKSNRGDGYCCVRWIGRNYKAHRLIYCLYNKVDVPTDLMIDHINGNRLDNSKENLRLVSIRDNQQNRIEHRNGKLQGCSLHKDGKWQARIVINSKLISLGLYTTEQKAHNVYLQACTMLDKPIEEIKEYFGIGNRSKYSSKFAGVSFHQRGKRWQARVTINGKQKHIGLFKTQEEAYDAILLTQAQTCNI